MLANNISFDTRITPDIVRFCVGKLKPHKDDGKYGFKSDHLINGTNKLFTVFSIMFNAIVVYLMQVKHLTKYIGDDYSRFGSKRHSLQAVKLSQWFEAAVQIVSNLPAPSNGGPIYRFLGMPAMRTRWMAGAAAHKSG